MNRREGSAAMVGRVLAAYGGVFVAGSLPCGMVFGVFRPDRFDLAGASICLIGVAVIMWPDAKPHEHRRQQAAGAPARR